MTCSRCRRITRSNSSRLQMRRFLALVVLAAAGAAHASQPDVTALMENYWHAYSRSNFTAAAARLDPRDRGALKDGLLPMFLEAPECKNANVVPLVKAFFSGVPPDDREDMRG